MSLRSRSEAVSYSDRDTLLYALSIGLGRDPGNRHELAYVSEHAGLRALPAFASALVPGGLLEDCGWDAARVVHQADSLTLERPLEDAGSLLIDSAVAAVIDQGAETGALIVVESRARRSQDDQLMFSLRRTLLARGDGGLGGPCGAAGIAAHPMPARAPDLSAVLETRAEQALLFRLCGNRDPGYVNPVAPRLHEACIYGIACHAVLRVICEYDHTLIRSFAASFAGPVTPGETLQADLWQDANVVSFRLRVPGREAIVLDHGRCVLAT
ncbi:MAG: MaoC family dehydratase N-terminal domain-containing protein [Gammaproteobacteria bacterium]